MGEFQPRRSVQQVGGQTDVPEHNVVGSSELCLQMCWLCVFSEGGNEAGRQFAFDDVAQLDCDRLQDEDRFSHVALFWAAAI